MKTIQKCSAYKIKNSRGEETIEVEMSAGDFSATASVPSGKSRGSKEAVALPANEAIKNVNEIIAPKIIGKETDVFEIDKFLLELDGTENKSNLGANAVLGVSIATLKLSAKLAGEPLWQHIQSLSSRSTQSRNFPHLFANVLNGGAHGEFNLPFQEYMLVLGNGSSVVEPFKQLQVLFEKLGEILREKYDAVPMGDEGGYSPKIAGAGIKGIEEPFEILNHLGLGAPSKSLGAWSPKWAVDAAASGFYKNAYYEILDQKYSSDELLEIYKNLVRKFPITGLEDPFAENDFEAFTSLTKKMKNLGTRCLSGEVLVVGDDLTTTNSKMIKKAVLEKSINAVIIKPNQIGTVSETLEAVKIAREAGLKIIVSHRSGETMDSFIADLAVGVGAYGIKAGAPSQPERTAKYERLLEIEKEMKK
ncbi:MAG: phosphopyruvate hydratase [Candidatus Pacebacteria bacterium]|nr:phosphopyruvate hydratase [Candidatus Paceibacterota bacterium]